MVAAVADALAAVTIGPVDAAAAELARAYAEQIEFGGDLAKLGPPLLAALESLGMTPRSRKAIAGGSDDPNPIDELLERRTRAGRGKK